MSEFDLYDYLTTWLVEMLTSQKALLLKNKPKKHKQWDID